MKYTAAAVALAALSIFTPTMAMPTSAGDVDDTVNFGFFKVTQCARNEASHIESHDSVPNGECAHLDWARSIAYKYPRPHTQCTAVFYQDYNCTQQVATPQPLYTSGLIDNYYPNCFDDISSLGATGPEVLVENTNVRITCS